MQIKRDPFSSNFSPLLLISIDSFYVSYEGSEYKVVCLRGFAVLARQALPETPKLSKKLMVEVEAVTSDEKPEKAKDDDRAFSVTRVVVLDKRLQKLVYPLLLP